VLLAVAVGVTIGDSLGRQLRTQGISPQTFILAVEVVVRNVAWVANPAIPLLALAIFGWQIARSGVVTSLSLVPSAVAPLALVTALVAQPPAQAWASLALPAWLASWLFLTAIVRRRAIGATVPADFDRSPVASALHLNGALSAEVTRAHLAELNSQASSDMSRWNQWVSENASARRGHPDDARRFLEAGACLGWIGEGRRAAGFGLLLSPVPLAYYLWNILLSLPERLDYAGALFLTVDLLGELGRYAVFAFMLGASYRVLPTRWGPSKAVVLVAAWSGGALLARVVASWLGLPNSVPWLYLTLQMALFLAAVALAYDLSTVRRAGGTWRRLGDLYRVHNLRQAAAFGAPVALALVGLFDQIRAGAPGEVAQQVVQLLAAASG
jgi:hypothetical protein